MKKILLLTLTLTLAILPSATYSVTVPGSSFPVTNSPPVWARILMVDTNGNASTDLNTKSNLTMRWDVLTNTTTALASNVSASQIASTSNLLANLSGGFHVLIGSNFNTAQIQSAFNNSTNGAVVEFQPGNYTITAPLTITNSLYILGNGAWLNYQLGLTNYMLDTGTNFGKALVIDNLNCNGGVLAAYNTSAYFDSAHLLPNGIYGDVYWSNRTAMRIESSGDALITRCVFTGWSGNAILGLSTRDQLSYQSGKLSIFNNTFETNFVDIMLPGQSFEVPGYHNSPTGSWNQITPHYAIIANNNGHGSQMGCVFNTGNVSAFGNEWNNDYFGLIVNPSMGSHRVYNNNFNHDNTGILVVGSGLPGGQDFYNGNTMIGMVTNAFVADAALHFIFEDNLMDKGMDATNGCIGVIRNNLLFSGYVWGTTFYTNFSPGVLVYNNSDQGLTSFDPSATSVMSRTTNSPTPGVTNYWISPDGTNGMWTTNAP